VQWGWKWIFTWQKVSTTQHLISQNHRTQQADKLLPLCAEKTRERAREEIGEKISPLLYPVAVSELVVGVLHWRARTWWSESSGGWHVPGGQDVLVVGTCSKGLAPSPFIPFGCPSPSFLKVLENESVGMCVGILAVSHSSPKGKCSASLPR